MKLYLILISLTVMGGSIIRNAEASSCSDSCRNKFYSGSKCYGIAPICEGRSTESPKSLQPYWMDGESPVIKNGRCTAGGSCLTGHKECTCWKDYSDCSSTCSSYPIHPNNDYLLRGSWTSTGVPEGYDAETAQIAGAKVAGGDDFKITYCWCLYSPAEEWSSITGAWASQGVVSGENSFTSSLSVGTESTDEYATTSEWSSSFTGAVAGGFDFMGVGGGVEVSGTIAQATATSITSATTHSYESSCSTDCPSPSSLGPQYKYNYLTVWQWAMNGYKNGIQTTTIENCDFHCIYGRDSSPVPPKCPPTDCLDATCQTCISTSTRMLANTESTDIVEPILAISVRNGNVSFSDNFPKEKKDAIFEKFHTHSVETEKTNLRNKPVG